MILSTKKRSSVLRGAIIAQRGIGKVTLGTNTSPSVLIDAMIALRGTGKAILSAIAVRKRPLTGKEIPIAVTPEGSDGITITIAIINRGKMTVGTTATVGTVSHMTTGAPTSKAPKTASK